MLQYCPPNITFTDIWDHGLSHCFLDTICSSFIFSFILLAGGVEWFMYRKYATLLDTRLLSKSCLFKFQIFLIIFLCILQIGRLILQVAHVLETNIYAYMVLSAAFMVLSWILCLRLIFIERYYSLPSIPTHGHGLVLLLFWTLCLTSESLVFLNLQKETWWFNLNSISHKVDFGLFVLRYISTLLVYFIGIKAPGLPSPRDYFLYAQNNYTSLNQSDSEAGLTRQASVNQGSAFSNFGAKVRQLLPFLWPKKSFKLQAVVVFCFVLLISGRVLNVFIPLLNKTVVDSLTPSEKHPLEFPWKYILIYVTLWFFQGQGTNSAIPNLRSFLWINVQQYTVREVQVELYAHLHSLSLRWHLGRKTGEVLKILDRGTTSVTTLLSYIIFNIFPAFADIIIACVYFTTSFNAWFGLIIFTTMVLYLALTVILTEWRTKYRRDMNLLDNAAQARGVDALLNFETVKYYNAEDYEIGGYKKCIEEYQVAEWKVNASLNLLNSVQTLIISLGVLAGTLLCAHLVAAGKGLTVGDYVLFLTYVMQLYQPLNFLGTYYRMIQRSFIDMENMFELLGNQPEVVDKINAQSLRLSQGEIEFRNVFFSYQPERPIIKNVSFKVSSGKTVALVGPTGSGKSTIIRLLFRFYDIQSGEIFVDGQNVANVKQKSLRQVIGVVPQDTVLFNKDIRYNIRYGNVTATDEEVEKAARAADIHDQILGFPKGYDTLVGERGLKLSGGEKQRVAIARTILKAPAVVLLDEATSSLDTQTERNIQASLDRVCKNRTTIIVAHRLSTVVHADEILVLRDGEIVERGTHDELLFLGQVYARMWQQQADKPSSEENDDTLLVDLTT